VGAIALYVHRKFEVSILSRSGDMRAITDRIIESQTDTLTDKTTNVTTGFKIASFAYRRAQA